jgi:hypothetical protein
MGGMQSQSSDRTGILIVRLWNEGSAREGFRARITQTLDSSGPEEPTGTAESEPQDIYDTVQTWVEAFVEQETPTVLRAVGAKRKPS